MIIANTELIEKNAELIEKIKLFNLAKAHNIPRAKQWPSFDSMQQKESDDAKKIFESIPVKIFDYDEKTFESIINNKEFILFTVRVQKNQLPDICGCFEGRLLEMEWDAEDSMLLRMVNQPEAILAKAQNGEVFYYPPDVKLGRAVPLRFQDFQIFFSVDFNSFLSWCKANGDIGGLVCCAFERCLSENLLDLDKICDKIAAPDGGRYISKKISLEDFLFSNTRVQRYFTAVDDPNSLDFVLTYRNCDILNAIRRSDVQKYLKTCEVRKVKSKFQLLPLVLSLVCPSCILEHRNFWYKLLCLSPSLDVVLKELSLTFKLRKNFSFVSASDNASRIFVIFSQEKKICLNLDELAKLSENNEVFCKFMDALKNPTYKTFISAEDKAKALDRSNCDKTNEIQDRWSNEDYVRYVAAYGVLAYGMDCEKFVTFVKIMQDNYDFLKNFMSSIQTQVLSCKGDQLRTGINFFWYNKTFEPPEIENSNRASFISGSFADYFCNSTWDGETAINGMEERSLDKSEEIYHIYLNLNMYLEKYSSCFAGLPLLYEKYLLTIRTLADIEIHTLKCLLENGKDIKQLAIKDGNLEVMPDSHLAVLYEKEKRDLEKAKREAEAKRREAEIKQQTQKEVFTTLNHSIKNLVMSVTTQLGFIPFEELSGSVQRMISTASQGANLISSITRAITFSYRDDGHLWKRDIKNVSEDVSAMDQIILAALFHSVPNILSGKNINFYRRECKLYFPTEEEFKLAEESWYQASDEFLKIEWINKFLFPLNLSLDDSLRELWIDDEYCTTTHFFILFNEIFLNAIKALARVDKKSRRCEICVSCHERVLIVNLSNTANGIRVQDKSGFGHIIIENYCKKFDIMRYDERFDNEEKKYNLYFELPLL